MKWIARRLAWARAILSDPQTPRLPKLLLGAAVVYLISPIDLVPDWIPVLGQLDDLLVVPALVGCAVLLLPREVLDRHRPLLSDPGAHAR